MKLKGQEYQEEMRKIKQDRDDFRTFMKQVYDYNVSEKQQMKKMEVTFFIFFLRFYENYVFAKKRWRKN